MIENYDGVLGGREKSLNSYTLDSLISSGTEQAKTDPLGGLSSLLKTGSLIGESIEHAHGFIGMLESPALDLTTSLSYLSRFKEPNTLLADLGLGDPYRGTLGGLAIVAEVADSITGFGLKFPSAGDSEGVTADKFLSFPGVEDQRGLAHALTSPYLASTESVFSLESTYADILSKHSQEYLIPGASFESINSLRDDITSLTAAARGTWDLFSEKDTVWGQNTLPMLQYPALGTYTNVQAAGAITLAFVRQPQANWGLEEMLAERIESFPIRLGSLDPELVEPYYGAIDAIRTGGADWQRHSMTSLRELTTQVLHRLAPNEEILRYATTDDLHNGSPTRRARLEYIFSSVDGPELADFLEADMKATLRLLDLLNSGTHKLGNKATPQQLHYIQGRVAGLLNSMLEVQGY